MVTVDELHSEVVVEGGEADTTEAATPHEVQIEELRELVRELISEELYRFLRTETHR